MNDKEFQAHHLPQPCMFCPNMAGYSPLGEMEYFRVSVYFCHNCNAEYLYYRDGTRASHSLYIKIEEKTYRWTVTCAGEAVLFYVKEPGIPGVKKNEGLTAIMSFNKDDKYPYITPQTIETKIRVWLPFL